MPEHCRHPIPGSRKTRRILLHVCAILLLIVFGTVYVLSDFETVLAVASFLSQPLLLFLGGLCVWRISPHRARNTVFCLLVLAMGGYTLFWLYVFFLVWYTGLPPWKIGSSPWM